MNQIAADRVIEHVETEQIRVQTTHKTQLAPEWTYKSHLYHLIVDINPFAPRRNQLRPRLRVNGQVGVRDELCRRVAFFERAAGRCTARGDCGRREFLREGGWVRHCGVELWGARNGGAPRDQGEIVSRNF